MLCVRAGPEAHIKQDSRFPRGAHIQPPSQHHPLIRERAPKVDPHAKYDIGSRFRRIPRGDIAAAYGVVPVRQTEGGGFNALEIAEGKSEPCRLYSQGHLNTGSRIKQFMGESRRIKAMQPRMRAGVRSNDVTGLDERFGLPPSHGQLTIRNAGIRYGGIEIVTGDQAPLGFRGGIHDVRTDEENRFQPEDA